MYRGYRMYISWERDTEVSTITERNDTSISNVETTGGTFVSREIVRLLLQISVCLFSLLSLSLEKESCVAIFLELFCHIVIISLFFLFISV